MFTILLIENGMDQGSDLGMKGSQGSSSWPWPGCQGMGRPGTLDSGHSGMLSMEHEPTDRLFNRCPRTHFMIDCCDTSLGLGHDRLDVMFLLVSQIFIYELLKL